nr:hypothetical protein CFP56_15958 [Quercus suber]
MKATGSRGRSPQWRDQYRDEDDHGSDKRRTVQQQPVEVVGREYGGSSGESDIRSGGDKRINDDNVNIGCASEILLADPVHQAEQSMAKDMMGKSTLDDVLGPSIVGLHASNGPTNASDDKRPQDVDKQLKGIERCMCHIFAHRNTRPPESLIFYTSTGILVSLNLHRISINYQLWYRVSSLLGRWCYYFSWFSAYASHILHCTFDRNHLQYNR